MANDEMFTPKCIIEAAREVMGCIDLDPASCEKANETVKADLIFDKSCNGLNYHWSGNVWCNPPYSRGNMPLFVEKIINCLDYEFHPITQCCLLCNAQAAAKWFHKALNNCDAMLIFDKRISFIDGETGKPKKGNDRSQVMFYFGRYSARFYRVFKKYGTVVQAVRDI